MSTWGEGASDTWWRDITADVTVRGIGGNDPTWAQMGTGPLYAYQFGVDDECRMCWHVPHDIWPDRDFHLHAHWVADGTNTQPVKWQWQYAYARGFDQEPFPVNSTTTVTAEEAGPGVAWQHMVTETAAITETNWTEPDGLVYACIKRITNGGTENTDAIFLLTSDVHYQCRDKPTVSKAPDFYP